jgi:excisionase family DNA binding protein
MARNYKPITSPVPPVRPAAITLLTVPDIAQHYQVSERSVRRWIANGMLPVVRLGRTVRIHPDEADALLARSSRRD